ncbi:TolC family protein [Tautonia plasticadhaerens]|uniref:Outer membrane efflux protein n=1 Tax=Tautonia plasticadhaerens TaxID=2527974 RepID=A0A518H7F9_9BACT|nr:TolC family protein [Tautonia plasticadhaerens]QDV36809.1 hypothetical protein ElP_47380 [Tautonia plasticadhaerens]
MSTSKTRRASGSRSARLALAIAALAASPGCTREFFRNWADQDVTEAIFEKSRDPRHRIDLFTITPPPTSRFSDPYDPDRPPAPPDDYVAQELNPQPQRPRHRLITPAEGTGYLDLLEQWRRERGPRRRPVDVTVDTGPSMDEAAPPPSRTPSPFPPDPNRGPGEPGMSPIPGETPGEVAPPDPRRLAPDADAPPEPLSSSSIRDNSVLTASLQIPEPVIPGLEPEQSPSGVEDVPPPQVPPDFEPGPSLFGDEGDSPEAISGLSESAAEGAGGDRDLIEILKPDAVVFDEARAAGLGAGIDPYIVDGRQILTLALQNSRAYQFRLEDLYLQALNVTLQRFQFTPQFAAGLNPGAPAFGGFTGPTPGNSYIYRTEETGSPSSLLSVGGLAGFGKLLSFGTSVTGNFANQTVINFGGPNAVETTSQSFLPLNLVIPFLRGGGRAVTLEPLTQQERALLYEVRDFARFRKEFFVSVLAGGGITGGGGDPLVGFLEILRQIQALENNTKNVAAYERVLEVFQELSRGAASTVRPLDLVNVEIDLQNQRLSLLSSSVQYRNQLDNFKQQLGLPPDVPMVPATDLLEGFRRVFDEIDALKTKPRPVLEELIGRLPALEDVVINGRPVIARFREAAEIARRRQPLQQRLADRQLARSSAEQQITLLTDTLRQGLGILSDEEIRTYERELDQAREVLAGLGPELDRRDQQEISDLIEAEREVYNQANDQLEDLLRSGQRVALENRLDLMNARATLYDAWRQLAVTANALQGIFTATLSNQYLTPLATSNNPFGFDEQTKQFNLALRAELPLIRLSERNQYVASLIAYQRARRSLMQVEDSLKNQLRQNLRQLQVQYQGYEIQKTSYIAALVTLDQSFQSFLEPPRSTGGSSGGSQLVLTLLRGLNGVNNAQNGLISSWVQYQTTRLALYRDLGIMPYDEWEAFYELFPAASPSASLGDGAGGVERAPAPPIVLGPDAGPEASGL